MTRSDVVDWLVGASKSRTTTPALRARAQPSDAFGRQPCRSPTSTTQRPAESTQPRRRLDAVAAVVAGRQDEDAARVRRERERDRAAQSPARAISAKAGVAASALASRRA